MDFCQVCERNKHPILEVLTVDFANCSTVLEVGSGTGQHAVHFAAGLSHVEWQPTERAAHLKSLTARIAAESSPNVQPPRQLDVLDEPWSVSGPVDAVFTANTLHIMSWNSVEHFFRGVGCVLGEAGLLCVYGPFLYADIETTPSNVAFDQSLRARDAESGIRQFEAVDALAAAQGLTLRTDHAMPANNRLLVWARGPI